MKTKSIKGSSPEEIKAELDKSRADGFMPTLAIMFISIKMDRKAVCKLLHDDGIDILGATSCGEFINGHQSEGEAVILLLNLPHEAYTILYEDINGSNESEAATSLAQAALQKFNHPAFILCSTGLSVKAEFLNGDALVRSFENVVGPQVNIYGGMAGDDGTFTGTYAFTYEKESDRAIAALVLDEDKISLQGMAISGWKPIGVFRTVTKSSGNMLYTIDDQPAIDMYLKYLGKSSESEDEKYSFFDEVGVHYPFQVEREMRTPVMVTPMTINRDENALVCDFDIPQGSKLRFSMPPDFDIVEKVIEEADELKNASQAEAEALLIFSCAGRVSALGPLAHAENEGLSDVWKAPMAGFFTYGEYGRAINGRQELHSTTCCWVALKEK